MAAPYGALTVGRVTLTEGWEIAQKTDASGTARTVTVSQEESSAVLSADQDAARARVEALLSMAGTVVPVTFTVFTHLDGWYKVGAPSVTDRTWWTETIIPWTVELTRVGGDSEVEVESRLVGGDRTTVHGSASAERWHAPAAGADSYLVGSSTPGYVDRGGADGDVRVWRAIPAATDPRWSVPVASALDGAVSVTVDGVLLAGTSCADTPANWSVDNTLIRVQPRTSTGTLIITSYLDGSGWGTGKVFDVKRGAVSLGAADHVTVLRVDACAVVARLTWDHAPGRTTCDLTLQRGARHVALYIQQYEGSSALRVDDNGGGGSVDDQLSAYGYILRTDADGDSNRWLIGSPIAVTAAGTFGLTASTPATGLAAFVGVEYAGSGAQAGDTAAQVNNQYLGAATETEQVIAR
jgi:hypothetical protein